MTTPTTLESVLKRDRTLVISGLVGTTALAWLYLVSLAANMGDMGGAMGDTMLTARTTPWTATQFLLMFLMWAVMMVGMMLPSAAPMILLFATVNRRRHDQGRAVIPTAVFAGGYVGTWTAFSLGATLLQWSLHEVGLLSPMMTTTSTALGGGALIAAGIYQWTPLKGTCLRHCQSPLQFISQHWRSGTIGALRVGWKHGLYCLGCCWILMGLLFVGGVMNLLWIAGLALFVLLEKALASRWVPMVGGVILVIWGTLVLTSTG